MPKLDGRKAIVTGAGFGIGRAIAQRLAADGCDVGVFDLSEAPARETVALVQALGRKACLAVGSAASRADVERATASLVGELGGVDILVNNAGILRTAPFLEISERDWRDIFAVNLDGVFYFCQTVLPHMLARKRGSIVNMSSWTGKKGAVNHAAYSASKFAVIGLTQSIAGELAERGIRVNAVCPGVIVDTRMRDEAEALNKAQGLPDLDARTKVIPMRRGGTPAEIASVVAFLASDDAAYMTGQAINITGGLWMN
jgi:NAD(P)-dependent dehydrogenase (short-subunit alcohol dehydrogenase family)